MWGRQSTERVRILLYAEQFHPSVGGVQTFVKLLAHGLHEAGDHVCVLTEANTGVRAGNGAQVAAGTDDASLFPYPIVRAPSLRATARLIRGAEVVHLQGFRLGVFLLAKLFRKKLVFTYHDLTMICPKGRKWRRGNVCTVSPAARYCLPCLREDGGWLEMRKLIRPPMKALISCLAHANVCISPFAQARFKLARKRLIANGVETGRYQPTVEATRRTSETGRVLFFGRFEPEKGVQVLLRAAAEAARRGEPINVDLLGEGPYAEQLRALTDELGLNERVRFHGMKTGQALTDWIHSASVVVIPSLWPEPFGLSAAEAMSSGTPTIASDTGGLADVVRDAGLLFPVGDARKLADHICWLLSDELARQRIGRRCREKATAQYDWRRMARDYRVLYHRLCRGAAPPEGPVEQPALVHETAVSRN